MDNSLNNPHDKFFKAVFSDLNSTRKFLEHFLPKKLLDALNLSSLKEGKASFISPKLKGFHSDINFECKLEDQTIKISILLEHKSDPPTHPHLQLLRYMLEMWDHQIKSKLPVTPVVAAIIYHGKRTWTPKNFDDYPGFSNELIKQYIPGFDYIAIDISNKSDEEILDLETIFLVNALLAFKHYGEKEYFNNHTYGIFANLSKVVEIENQKFRNYVLSLFVYIIETCKFTEEEVENLIKKVPEPLKKINMTGYEAILEKGRREGRQEARQEALEEVIVNAFNKGIFLQDIAELVGKTIEYVQSVLKRHELIKK